MSFLKINDPKKRDFIVDQFLKTKENIQKNYISERLGESNIQRELSKVFKPITETQKTLTESIVSEIKPITQKLTKAISFPQFPSIKAYDDGDDGEEEEEEFQDTEMMFIGDIAGEYLRKFANKAGVDKTFGLYDKNGKFFIGNMEVEVIDNDLKVGDKLYKGTPGLWELIISKEPSSDIYTPDDFDNYAEIVVRTNSMKQNNDPNEIRPKSSRGYKWNRLLKTVWDKKDRYEGRGTVETVVIPSDPNALLERLDLLMASKMAGNTGVRNELVSICDELLRQKAISKKEYKTISALTK